MEDFTPNNPSDRSICRFNRYINIQLVLYEIRLHDMGRMILSKSYKSEDTFVIKFTYSQVILYG